MKVMLVISEPRLKATVKEILNKHGIQIAAEADGIRDFGSKVGNQEFDLLILDSDLEAGGRRKIVAFLERDEAPPVLLLAGEDESEIKDYPYVFKTMLPQALTLVIHNVVISYKKYRALLKEVERLNRQLASRKVVSIAKALIMEQEGLTEEEAHKIIQKMSMEKGIPLKKVAENIIGQFNSCRMPDLSPVGQKKIRMETAFSRQSKD